MLACGGTERYSVPLSLFLSILQCDLELRVLLQHYGIDLYQHLLYSQSCPALFRFWSHRGSSATAHIAQPRNWTQKLYVRLSVVPSTVHASHDGPATCTASISREGVAYCLREDWHEVLGEVRTQRWETPSLWTCRLAAWPQLSLTV